MAVFDVVGIFGNAVVWTAFDFLVALVVTVVVAFVGLC